MTLLIIYIFTAVLALINIGPLKVTAVLLGICYLPGLFLFVCGKRGKLAFEDLVLAYPVSLGISSLITIGLLYLGIQVKYIACIIYIITGLAMLCYIVTGYKKSVNSVIELGRSELVFLFVAFLATILLSIPVISERIAISAHGFHHSTMVTQILNGIFPPENPGMGGTALSYHWGHHALVAAISFPASWHPLRVISMLNIMSLFFIFCTAYRMTKGLNFSEKYCYLVPLALIGLMRSDAAIYFFNKMFSGNFMALSDIELAALKPLDILQNWIWGGGAPWFDRRLFFLNKFYNANTMPLGILLCLSYFLLLLTRLEMTHEHESNKINQISFTLIIIGCSIIYPPLAIIPLLHAPIWSGTLLLLKEMDFKGKFKRSLNIVIPYSIAVIIVLPYFLSVTGDSREPAIRAGLGEQAIRNLILFWLPAPVILFGIWRAVKKLPSTKSFFLLTGAFLCFGLSVFIRVAMWNSGKFTFILSFFCAVFFAFALSSLLSLISNRGLKRIIFTVIILFLLGTPIITELSYISSKWFSDNTYSFSGTHIVFAQDSQRNEAYQWIKDNTSPDALVMLTYVETANPYHRDQIAKNIIYEPTALLERNLFVVKDTWYTLPNPEYKKRVSVRKNLILSNSDPYAKKYLASLDRPIYLLVEEHLPSIYIRDKVFNNFPDDPEGFLLVFRNDRQRVYLLKS